MDTLKLRVDIQRQRPRRSVRLLSVAKYGVRALATIVMFHSLQATLAQPTQSDASRIVDHIQLLSSNSFSDRESATEALLSLGVSALPELRAVESRDAEVLDRIRNDHGRD